MNASVQESGIDYPDCRLGVFDARPLWKGEIDGCYYGSLVYYDLGRRTVSTEYFREGMLKVSVSESRMWSNQLGWEITVDGVRHALYIIPETFCATMFGTVPRYRVNDRE